MIMCNFVQFCSYDLINIYMNIRGGRTMIGDPYDYVPMIEDPFDYVNPYNCVSY